MTTPLPLRDRAALAWYLARVRVWLTGAPRGRARSVVVDLRREASATAAETGMAAALADLGSPRTLAGTYVEESGAPLGSRAVRVVALTTALVVGLAAFGVWRWYSVASTPRLTTLGYALDAGFSELATTGQQVALDATEPLTVGVPVKNEGPVSVTIDTEDVELVQVRFSTEDATADPPSFTFDPDNGELLERVVLGPGEEVDGLRDHRPGLPAGRRGLGRHRRVRAVGDGAHPLARHHHGPGDPPAGGLWVREHVGHLGGPRVRLSRAHGLCPVPGRCDPWGRRRRTDGGSRGHADSGRPRL